MTQPSKSTRSRGGCAECRRRHRRCDEVKPVCGYCKAAEMPCSYARGLSWGGRAFRKSRFGACGGGESQLVMIVSEQDSFVYGARPTCQTNEPVEAEADVDRVVNADANADTDTNVDAVIQQPLTLENTPPQLPVLTSLKSPELSIIPERFRPLLAYFQHSVAQALSCHPGIQHDICTALLPIALQSPHLLAGVLCVAASHRRAAGLAQAVDEIVRLRSTATQSLGFVLSWGNVGKCDDGSADVSTDVDTDVEAALGTSLVLCVCEIVLPEADDGSSWRWHLAGASALLSHLRTQRGRRQSSSRAAIFMERLYRSLQAIAQGCRGTVGDGGDAESDDDEDQDTNMDDSSLSSYYIDDLAGFSTVLMPVFRAIDRLNHKMRQTAMSADAGVDAHIQKLIRHVRFMLTVRSHSSCHPDLAGLSEVAQTDFYLLDEAYHHMALLQLYQFSHTPLSGTAATHASVRRIVSCIADMRIDRGPCPGVAVLPPLFMAGRAATDERDRERILTLLHIVWRCFGMGNVMATREFLQRKWGLTADSDLEQSVYGTETWEFLPY